MRYLALIYTEQPDPGTETPEAWAAMLDGSFSVPMRACSEK